MQKYSLLLVVFFFTASAISCRKTDDTKPFFEIISPSDADMLLLTDTIFFQAAFHDNEELSQFRIEIKNNFVENPDSLPAWKLIFVNTLTGKNETLQEQIVIPDTVFSGAYYFIVKCTDFNGNETAADTTELLIQ